MSAAASLGDLLTDYEGIVSGA